jgi:adhesin/invasin
MLSASSIQLDGATTITLQARDAEGNDETAGGLKVAFALEKKTGAKGTFNAAKDNKNGTYTAIFKGTLDGSNTITATANGKAVTANAPITVEGAAVSLAESTVTVATSTIMGGTTTAVMLQAKYPKDNDEPAGGLTVVFKLGSTTGGQGTFSAVTDHGNGQYTAIFTGTLAGSNTIRAYIDGLAVTSPAAAIKVITGPLSLAHSPVTVSASTMKAGSTITVALQPEDAGGNKLKLGSNETVVFSLESGQGMFGSLTYNSKTGTYSATFTTTTAANYTIETAFNSQPVTSRSPTLTVTPLAASAAKSTVSAAPSNEVVSGESITVALQTVDAYGNLETTGGLAVVFKLVSGSGRGTFGKVTYIGNGKYQALFTGTIAGNNTIEATIGGVKAASTQAIIVTPGSYSLANSVVSVAAPGRVVVGNPITVTLQTKDAAGNTLTTNLLTAGVSIALALSSKTGGQGSFGSVSYLGNGEYQATFTATAVGSNTVLALIGNAKLTSKAGAITVT